MTKVSFFFGTILSTAILIFLNKSMAQSDQSQLVFLEPSVIEELPDAGGGFGILFSGTMGKIGSEEIAGLQVNYFYNGSPFLSVYKEVEKIWSIDDYYFRNPDSMKKYIRSIPAGRAVKVIWQSEQGKMLEGTFEMPSDIRINTLKQGAETISMDRNICELGKTLMQEPNKPCSSKYGNTLEELRQNEIGIYLELIPLLKNDDNELRKELQQRLEELQSEN